MIALYLPYVKYFFWLESPTASEKLLFAILKCLAASCHLFAALTLASTYWNWQNKITRYFTKHSYEVYVIHYPVLTVFQILIVKYTQWPLFIKAISTGLFALAAIHLICSWLLKPMPRLTMLLWFMITGAIGYYTL